MAKKPIVDPDLCIGCEQCVEVCPDVFQMNDEDLSEVHNLEGASEEEIQEAIDICPVDAISWKDGSN